MFLHMVQYQRDNPELLHHSRQHGSCPQDCTTEIRGGSAQHHWGCLPRGGSLHRSCQSSCVVLAQRKEKGCALSRDRLCPDTTSMAVDNPFDDSESHPGALYRGVIMKSLEHTEQFIGILH